MSEVLVGAAEETVGALMEEAAACPLFLFVKEDENLYPRLDYSPASERTRRAVEAIRRVGRQIEVRLSEWSGVAGTGEVTLHLPHNSAQLTNLMGEQGVALAGGPTYRFPVRPQQIVTLRFDTNSGVNEPAPILSWKSLVPDAKQKALKVRLQAKGHPPRGY
jgi:hypothetical protein